MRSRALYVIALAFLLAFGILFTVLAASRSPSTPRSVADDLGPVSEPAELPGPVQAAPCCPHVDPPVEGVDVADMMRRMEANRRRRVEPIPVRNAVDALTRIVISEEGFGASENAIDALATVAHNTRSGDEPILETLRRLSPRTTVARRDFSMSWRVRWITTIEGTSRPRGWVECERDGPRCHGRWSRYVDDLERIRRLASIAIARRPSGACGGVVVAWGGDMDHDFLTRRNARRVAAGIPALVEVDCGDTRNHYFADPRRGPITRPVEGELALAVPRALAPES